MTAKENDEQVRELLVGWHLTGGRGSQAHSCRSRGVAAGCGSGVWLANASNVSGGRTMQESWAFCCYLAHVGERTTYKD